MTSTTTFRPLTTGLLNTALNVTSMICGMVGSVIIASNTGGIQVAYCLFLVSAITSVILMWGNKLQRGLFFTQAFYVGVNVFGLLRWSNIL
jgi:nicotinamide riboside transporter PnuC